MPDKRLSVLLLALALILAGCAAEKKVSEKTTPKPSKEIAIGVTDKITELDPANAYDFYT